ncbi:MAG: amidohydrolase family protein [Caldilineaceae bacterium]
MTTDLQHFIGQTPLCDTHEHLWSEQRYTTDGPDILQSLFDNYVTADLIVAGATQDAVATLLDKRNPDLAARFQGIATAWNAVRYTGYGEAVRYIARECYGIEELTPESIQSAQTQHNQLVGPGLRLQLLRDQARLDHVQIDNFTRACAPDPAGSDFFFYDISWVNFCNGEPDLAPLAEETGIEVRDLATLRAVMEQVFAQNAANAIAIKTQHAYSRTLLWQKRSDAEAARVLDRYLSAPETMTTAERLCLGDWCLARGVELGIAHDLPFKIHTGYYAGHSRMPVDYIHAGHLCALLANYPAARFVLMHTAYPYSQELVALAKHYPNVYVDLCWAWSIDPYSTSDFVRRYLHTVPTNKLFVFGGDTFWPTAAVAYAAQTRHWLNRTLQAEVTAELLSEADAIAVAECFMQTNQYACFNVKTKRQRVLGLGQ